MRSRFFVRKMMAVGVTASLFMPTFPMGAFAIDGADMGGETHGDVTFKKRT